MQEIPEKELESEIKLVESSEKENDDITKPSEIINAIATKTEESSVTCNEISSTATKEEIKDEIGVDATKLIDEIDLDFEEISDGELEEEARNKGLGDALGVDWASLVQESRKIKKDASQETTAKQRWQPHRVLLDIGVSFKYAGAEFASKLITNARAKLEEEKLEREKLEREKLERNKLKVEEVYIKKEVLDASEMESELASSEDKPEIKVDEKPEVQKPEEISDNLPIHPIAFVQVALQKEKLERANLFSNASGPNCRALSARRDLQLRRRLCGLPARELGGKCYEQYEPDPVLMSQAIKLFQKATGQVV